MRLEHFEAQGFRNLRTAFDLGPGLNVFRGPNGAGKTAVLEAVYVALRGRSFRGATLSRIVHHDADRMWVRIVLAGESGKVNVGVQRDRHGPLEVRVDGRGSKPSAVAELVPLQVMLPSAADLVFGAPGERRQFLDWGVFHVEHQHLQCLRDYRRVVRQRNLLLREAHGDEQRVSPALESWSAKLVELGEEATTRRLRYMERFTPMLRATLRELAPGLSLTVDYRSGWTGDVGLAQALGESRSRDVKLGVTQAGPHRADLRLGSESGPAAATLSRGQGKLVATAMRLAQAKLIAEATGQRSVFLIDDVGAELDDAHNQRFFEQLAQLECQVLATAARDLLLGDAFLGDRRMFHVEHGACNPE